MLAIFVGGCQMQFGACMHNQAIFIPAHTVLVLFFVMVSVMVALLAFESVFRRVWHYVAQHFQSAAQLNAKLPGRPIRRPV